MTQKTRLLGELRARRQMLGWELAEVSKLGGLDEEALMAWERGASTPDIAAVERWADVLGLKLGFVVEEAAAGKG
jgi:transcriptional regulator with XRE-family HTH domain